MSRLFPWSLAGMFGALLLVAGCGKELDYWFTDAVLHPKLNPNPSPPHQISMAELPPACRQVLAAP